MTKELQLTLFPKDPYCALLAAIKDRQSWQEYNKREGEKENEF